MSSLEDDIARIAALRRMPAEQVAEARERSAQSAAKAFSASRSHTLVGLFAPMAGTMREQMVVYDDLPLRSREFLKSIDRDISARRWRIALDAHGGDEEALIMEVRHLLDGSIAKV